MTTPALPLLFLIVMWLPSIAACQTRASQAAEPEPVLIDLYPELRPDGSTTVVGSWSDGSYTDAVSHYPERRPDGSVVLVWQWANGAFSVAVAEYEETRADGSVWHLWRWEDGPILARPVDPTPLATGRLPFAGTAGLVERPLADLAPEAAAYLSERSGPVGVAIVVPSENAMYTANGDDLFHMASVVKVAIMVTVMDRAIREGRDLTAREVNLLTAMITVSDNDAATTLWHEVGEHVGVGAYLRSIGLEAIQPNTEGCWGGSLASPRDTALLLAKLALGEILDESRRELALDLMSQVVPAQSWGVTAGIPDERPPGTLIGIKDGWYPGQCGWWVNSAGIILPGNEEPAYFIAVLTNEQESLDYAIETIEHVAAAVHAALHGN